MGLEVGRGSNPQRAVQSDPLHSRLAQKVFTVPQNSAMSWRSGVQTREPQAGSGEGAGGVQHFRF